MGGLKVHDKTQSLTLIGYKVRSGGDHEWKRYTSKRLKGESKIKGRLTACYHHFPWPLSMQFKADKKYQSTRWSRLILL